MIDEKNKIIYIDHSTRSMFQACKEKARLGSMLGWRANESKASLSFGHAIHAGWQAYYDALAGGWHDENGKWHLFLDQILVGEIPSSKDIHTPTEMAQAAFLRDLGHTNASLPVQLENEERRSLERGLYLLEAYIWRWRNEPYENIIINGAPLTEIPVRYYIGKFEGYELWYVGYIDRAMRNIMTKRPVGFEGKTTTSPLSMFVLQSKPNHQITGYFPALRSLLGDEVIECVWDCVFISDRRPNLEKGLTDRFWAYGIDIDKDFARSVTTRSVTDVSEFMIELEEDAIDYARWLTSGKARWPRTAPGACHAYGGCQFRNRCMVNLDASQENQYMESLFKQERWEPWRKIVKNLE